ncbi:MAG: NYN domain-containing protein [Mesorhizobium sp. SCN 65-12]|nr:MAG: NYN domain-containing protein [Mesorhizobium sp. SCN 65-12]
MGEYVYVDNSNLFIEARRVSAVQKGYAPDIWVAMQNRITDNDYSIDFGRLHEFIAGGNQAEIKRAVLFGSRPPPNDSIWTFATKAGFELVLVDRNVANQEKKVDTGMVTMIMRDAYKAGDPASTTITIVAGDSDFVPTVQALKEDGFAVDIVFWDHAARELRDEATRFISLNKHLKLLAYSKRQPPIKKR